MNPAPWVFSMLGLLFTFIAVVWLGCFYSSQWKAMIKILLFLAMICDLIWYFVFTQVNYDGQVRSSRVETGTISLAVINLSIILDLLIVMSCF